MATHIKRKDKNKSARLRSRRIPLFKLTLPSFGKGVPSVFFCSRERKRGSKRKVRKDQPITFMAERQSMDSIRAAMEGDRRRLPTAGPLPTKPRAMVFPPEGSLIKRLTAVIWLKKHVAAPKMIPKERVICSRLVAALETMKETAAKTPPVNSTTLGPNRSMRYPVKKARVLYVSIVIERIEEMIAREVSNSPSSGFRKRPKDPRVP